MPAARPNILYVITDQLSANALSCTGNPYLQTPALDRLAAQSRQFANAYCAYPLCTPARASMFFGLYPHEMGIAGNRADIPEPIQARQLGRLLSAAGYDCAYGGKWHVPQIAMPEGAGFRVICGFDDCALPGACERFLAEPRNQPFFLVASFDNPHNICEWRREQPLPWGPVGAPPAVEDCPPLPPNFAPPPFEAQCIRPYVAGLPAIYPGPDYSPEQWRRYRWAYNRLVEKVDAQIGRILDALAASGHDEDTLVIFTSDHGDHQGSHQLAQKSVLYESAAHVPLMIRLPGPAGLAGVDENMVSNGPDLYATICDYAGVRPPEHVPGASLRPLLEGPAGPWRDHVVAETVFDYAKLAGRMVRTARYKYQVYDYGAYREMLFDLQNDPGEMVNLAVASQYAGVLQQHRDRLAQWCRATSDGFYGRHYSHPQTPFMVPGMEYPQSE